MVTATVRSLFVMSLLAACDGKITPEDSMARAEEFRADGDLRAAIIELRNAVQADPYHATAQLLLGRAYVDIGSNILGERSLERAHELGIDFNEVIEPLGKALLRQGKVHDVIERILPELTSNEADLSSILSSRGDAFVGLNHGILATLSYGRALETDPQNVVARVGLTRVAVAGGNYDQAQAHLRLAEDLAPGNSIVLAAKGDVALGIGDLAGAEDAYLDAVDLEPTNIAYRIALARAQLENGKTDAAIFHLDTALSQQPSNLEATYFRAMSAYQIGDYETAEQHSNTVLRADPHHLESLLVSGAAQFALGRWRPAYRQLDRFLFLQPGHVGAVKLRAATALRIDRSEDTLASLEDALARNAEDAQLLALIGATTLQSGNAQEAAEHFRRLVGLQPNDANFWQQLGLAELAGGNRAGGVAAIEQALAIDGNLAAAVRVLAIERLRDGAFDEVHSLAQRLQELEPENADGYSLAALAHLGAEDNGWAEASFRRALEVSPGDTNASIRLAQMLAQQNRSDEAQAVLETALEHDPARLVILLALADVAGLRGNAELRLSYLEHASVEHPEIPAPHILLARQHALDADVEAVLAVTERALLRSPDNADLLRMNAHARLKLRQLEEAVRPLERLISADPEALDARRLLIRQYLLIDRPFKAEDQLEELVRLDQSDVEARVQLFHLLIDRASRLGRASALLRDLKRMEPNHPDILQMEANLALLEGRPNDAVRLFSENVLQEQTSEATLRLAYAQTQAGNPKAGRDTLNDWLDAHPDDVSIRVALGNLLLASGEDVAAKTHFDHVAFLSEGQSELTGNHIVALNNLAWLHLEKDAPEKSLQLVERAMEFAPNDPRVMDTYAMALLATGRPGEAVELLKKALELLPDNEQVLENLRLAEEQLVQLK